MTRIGVVDAESYDKLANTIRAVYNFKGSQRRYSRDFSAEFAEELFFSPETDLPFVFDYSKNEVFTYKPTVLILNKINPAQKLEPGRDYKILLVNTDVIDLSRYFGDRRGSVISYGFNSRATITASSVRDNRLTVCIQRAIPTLNGGSIGQQEFSLTINSFLRNNISHMLAAVTAALVDS